MRFSMLNLTSERSIGTYFGKKEGLLKTAFLKLNFRFFLIFWFYVISWIAAKLSTYEKREDCRNKVYFISNLIFLLCKFIDILEF